MGFNRERDYIYQDLLSQSCEEHLISKTCLVVDDTDYPDMFQPEIIKRRLLRSKYLSLEGQAIATDVLKLLLVHREYITAEQMKYLDLYSTRSDATGVMLSRLLKKGGADHKAMLKSQNVNAGDTIQKVYYLTPATKRQTLELLPQRYLEDNNINTSDESPSLGAQLLHDVELLNTFYYLLADLNFMHFKWLSNIQFNGWETKYKHLRNAVQKRVVTDDTGVLRPDAVIISEEDEPLLSSLAVYVEQDMRTERTEALKDKFIGYTNFFEKRDVRSLAQEEVVFSVTIKNAVENTRRSSAEEPSFAKSRRELLAYIREKNTTNINDLLRGLSEIISINKKNDKPTLKSRRQCLMYINMKKVLSDAVAYAPNMDVIGAIDAYAQYVKEIEETGLRYRIAKRNEKQLKKRMEAIKGAALSVPEFEKMMLNGFSVHVIDSSMPYRLPYHLIQGYQYHEKLAAVIKRKYLKKSFKHTFSPSKTFQTDGRSYLLKNCLSGSPDDVPIIIENVSADIGGELRVRKFLTEAVTPSTKIYLFLLVDSEAAAREFDQSFQDVFSSSLSARFRKTSDVLSTRGGIHVAYISYEDEETLKNVFVVDADGVVVQC